MFVDCLEFREDLHRPHHSGTLDWNNFDHPFDQICLEQDLPVKMGVAEATGKGAEAFRTNCTDSLLLAVKAFDVNSPPRSIPHPLVTF